MPPGTSTDLTAEGKLDWAHWGLFTEGNFNHKYGVARQISWSFVSDDYLTDGPYQLNNSSVAFSWSNGRPVRAATNSPTFIYIFGDHVQGNTPTGFQVQCPADTTLRRLKLYVGTSGAQASFTATLSGATTYTDTSLNGATGPLVRVYTLDFQAGSAGQTLTVTFTSRDTSGYISLHAATLVGNDAPPTVAITDPADNIVFTAPASFLLTTAASDSDGTVTNLTLCNGSTLLALTGSGPLTLALANQSPNIYKFSSEATDDRSLSVTSFPVTVYITTNGGTLLGSVATPPTSVDLTAEGRTDWAHWGITTKSSFDHKSGVIQRIPNVVPINASTNEFNQYSGNLTTYSWVDGTPITATNSATGIFIYGTNDPPGGFRLTVPATNTLRQLKVYAGASGARGRLEAWLSDMSAPPYLDSSLSANAYQDGWAVYTFTFASSNPGTSLNITWTPAIVYDGIYGNVTWQAATLAEPPVLNAISNRTIAVGMTLMITNVASDPYGDPLTFSLAAGAAANASINPTGGVFTWTPDQTQLGANPFSVVVTDNGSPPLSATQSFTVTVVASNNPPALAAVSDRTIAVGTTLTITNVATDPDSPPQTLTFSLGGGAATNANLDAATGVFTWTPAPPQLGANTFSVVVSDNGLPPLSATRSFKLTVIAANSPSAPVLTILGPPGPGQFRLSFYGEAGVNYAVLFSDSLAPTNWQVLTNISGTGADALITVPEASFPQRFYRVQVQ